MGDRTTVYLTVLDDHVPVVEQIYDGDWQEMDGDAAPGHTTFTFEEVNYGRIDHLDSLRDRGVAYDVSWCEGSSYGAGTCYLRFTAEGTTLSKTVYDVDEDRVCLSEILRLVQQQGQSLAGVETVLLEHVEAQAALPWTDQLEFGKRYLARQLITT